MKELFYCPYCECVTDYIVEATSSNDPKTFIEKFFKGRAFVHMICFQEVEYLGNEARNVK